MGRPSVLQFKHLFLKPVLTVVLLSIASLGVAANPDWPEWLNEAMDKESPRLGKAKIKIGDGLVKSRTRGKLASDIEPFDGGWYVPIDIKAEAPIECYVYSEDTDLATLTTELARLNIESTADQYGVVSGRALYHLDSGAYGRVPWHALEWFFAVGEDPEKRVSLVKVRAAYLDQYTVACTHNMVGYRATFAAVFEELIKNLEIRDNESAAYYEELYIQRIGEQTIGFARATFTKDADGDTQIDEMSSNLVPVDNQTLQSSDERAVSYSYADGSLINQVSVINENGEVTQELQLTPADDAGWRVAGTFKGKSIEREFSADVEPTSSLGAMQAGRALLANDATTEVEMLMWIPSADPTTFLETRILLDAERGDQGWSTLSLGPIAGAAKMTADGSIEQATFQMGNVETSLERVWQAGEIDP